MRRIAIFAHHDPQNTIARYVIYYLKELQKVVDYIIFVSDSDLNNIELDKISTCINHAIVGRHGEYDFGSYKKGYIYAEKEGILNDYQELILLNDSCYAPLNPLAEMLSTMNNKNIDFWGITADRIEHYSQQLAIQSYFLVFKQNVFLSQTFKNFIESIKKESNKSDIVAKYEQGLTINLEQSGYKWDVYSQYSKAHWESCIIDFKTLIFDEKCPILKRSLVLNRIAHIYNRDELLKLIQEKTAYNVTLIREDIEYNPISLSLNYIFQLMYKTIGRVFIRIFQNYIKE